MNQLSDITADKVADLQRATPRRVAAPTVYARRFKRPFDLFICALLLPLIGPIVAVLWLLVRRDGGPGFYGHLRVGRGGKMFRCWKLRSMVPDADQCLQDHLENCPVSRREWDDTQKLQVDPRITALGRFLRKSSLDELPQLWNVIKGEMSLVGPRPVTTKELARYGSSSWAYSEATPGITGLWQVSGRNAVTYQRRVALDVRYVERLTFAQDMRILARTGSAVIRGTGA